MSKISELSDEDRQAIETFGEMFDGSDRPVVVKGGVGLLPSGETFREDARPSIIPEFPRESEQTAFALAQRADGRFGSRCRADIDEYECVYSQPGGMRGILGYYRAVIRDME